MFAASSFTPLAAPVMRMASSPLACFSSANGICCTFMRISFHLERVAGPTGWAAGPAVRGGEAPRFGLCVSRGLCGDRNLSPLGAGEIEDPAAEQLQLG